MEVMGPERVTHNSEGEVGEEERPADGALLPVWSGGEEEGEGGDMELDGEEEEHEEQHNEGYYYQPLTQEPEQPGEEGENRGEELQEVQSRMQVMGLHLPEPPPPDSDEEEDPDGAAAQRSRTSIPMDADHVELVKRTMAAVALPSLGVPLWAREISEDQWKDVVQKTLQSRQSAAALRLNRRTNVSGP